MPTLGGCPTRLLFSNSSSLVLDLEGPRWVVMGMSASMPRRGSVLGGWAASAESLFLLVL